MVRASKVADGETSGEANVNDIIDDYVSKTDTTDQAIASDFDFAAGKRPKADFLYLNPASEPATFNTGTIYFDTTADVWKGKKSTGTVVIPSVGGGATTYKLPPKYTVYYDSGDAEYKGMDEDGNIDYNDPLAATVVNDCFGNLTAARTSIEKVLLAGDITQESEFFQPSYSWLEIVGRLYLDDNSDCDMIRNLAAKYHDDTVTLLTADCNNTDTTCTLANVDCLEVNHNMRIDDDNSTAETVKITNINTGTKVVTFTPAVGADFTTAQNAEVRSYNTACIISGGLLHGNKGNNASGNGIYWRNGATIESTQLNFIQMFDLRMMYIDDDGIHIDGQNSANSNFHIKNFVTMPSAGNCDQYALYMSYCYDAQVQMVRLTGNGAAGQPYAAFFDVGGPYIVTGFYSGAGFRALQCTALIMDSFWVDNSSATHPGVRLDGILHCRFSDGVVHMIEHATDNKDGQNAIDILDDNRAAKYNTFSNLYLGRTSAGGATPNQWLNGIVEEALSTCDYNQYINIMADTKNDDPVVVVGGNSTETGSMEIDYANS